MRFILKRIVDVAILYAVLSALAFIASANASAEVNQYLGIISEIDSENDCVVAELGSGDIYAWYDEDSYEVGDVVIVYLDNFDTVEVFDDEVIGALKIGYAVGE